MDYNSLKIECHIAGRNITCDTKECDKLLRALRYELLKLEIDDTKCRYIVFGINEYERFLAWRFHNFDSENLIDNFNGIEIVVIPSSSPLAFLSYEDLYHCSSKNILGAIRSKHPNQYKNDIYRWFEKNDLSLKDRKLNSVYWVLSHGGYQRLIAMLCENLQNIDELTNVDLNEIFGCKLVISPHQQINFLAPNIRETYIFLKE